ncbi:MAG: hypothetical protein K1X57_16000 [Gemmataceae bacterium]|nr:hypothetical protein [Gemmataceae bacterium]
MAEKVEKLIIEAMRKAAIDRDGLPPLAARSNQGLFPSSTVGRAAAERAFHNGWFAGDDTCWKLTNAGLAMLLEKTSARQVLEDCVRALEARQGQIADVRATLVRLYGSLDGLRATVEQVLPALRSEQVSGVRPDQAILDALSRWQAEAAEDCPLPELFRQVELVTPGLSVGDFHDALRRLTDGGRIYLHPWTGPLYACPEPTYALLSGHEVAYYASGRGAGVNYQEEMSADEGR